MNNNYIFRKPLLPLILENNTIDDSSLPMHIQNKQGNKSLINPVNLQINIIPKFNKNKLKFYEEDFKNLTSETLIIDKDLNNDYYRLLKYYINYMFLIHYKNNKININDTENIEKLIEILKNLYKLIYYNYSDIISEQIEMIKNNKLDLTIRNEIIGNFLNLFDIEAKNYILQQEQNNDRNMIMSLSSSSTSVSRKQENRNVLFNNPILIRVPPDGDCGFHALSLFLRKHHEAEFTENEKNNVDILKRKRRELYKQESKNPTSLTKDMTQKEDIKNRSLKRINQLNSPINDEEKWLNDNDMILLARNYGLCFYIYKTEVDESVWEIITEDGILVRNNDYNQKVKKCDTKKNIFLHNPNRDHYDLIVPLDEIDDYRSLSFNDFEIIQSQYRYNTFSPVFIFQLKKKMESIINNMKNIQISNQNNQNSQIDNQNNSNNQNNDPFGG